MKLRVVFFVLVVCLSVIFFSCRRNQPSLVDANRPPDTELWYAPLDSTEYEWNVHMYWRGLDFDGVVVGYIWTITDTLEADPDLRWNPAERKTDLERGTLTTRTDEVIPFVAYKNVAGVGLRKNRQAFHIAAIDDNGVIDPTPAVIEFVATVGQLPRMRFHTTLTTKQPDGTFTRNTKLYNPASVDTLGMYRPFSLSFRGFTTNGQVIGYKYYPLTAGILVPGQDVWYSDLSDTVLYFPNRDAQILPSGTFRVVAQCRDQSGAESSADVKSYLEGVVQVIVNYEPDTEITGVENTYFINSVEYKETVDFEDDLPDTVPYDSWVRVDYRGWDDLRDSSLCQEDDQCIGYQFQLTRTRGATWRTLWYPPGSVQDSQPDEIPDSNTKNIGTWDYSLRVRAVDEYGKPDGSMFDPLTGKAKSEVFISGNFDPTLDSAALTNYDGAVVSETVDTVVWDWWNPANADTIDLSTGEAKKIFYLELTAAGHDHPKETRLRDDGQIAGIVNWQYDFIRQDTLEPEQSFFFGQGVWRASEFTNTFTQRFEVQYRYSLANDPGGATIWANPPAFWNSGYEMSLQGRDLDILDEFEEILFYWDPVDGSTQKVTINQTRASESAKRTEVATQRFFLKVTR